jgi:leucyl-tRNA synthetase
MKDSEFALIPVHTDYISQHGTPSSHLNYDGVKQFIAWRPEFANASFISKDAKVELGKLVRGSDIKLVTKSEVGKMSKRYFNVVNPDDVVAKYGADCFRMYEMFLGPIEQSKPWDTNGIDGVSKFLRKYWNLSHSNGSLNVSEENPTAEEMKILHTAIKKVSEDIERFSMNTTISAFMVCVNELKRLECNKKDVIRTLNLLLAPFAPFITEEIHTELGGVGSVHHQTYPKFDASFLKEDTVLYPICVNGKKKDEIKVSKHLSNSEIESLVLNLDSIKKWIDTPPKKVIIVPGRMINLVV